jgi:hypothetical protein
MRDAYCFSYVRRKSARPGPHSKAEQDTVIKLTYATYFFSCLFNDAVTVDCSRGGGAPRNFLRRLPRVVTNKQASLEA